MKFHFMHGGWRTARIASIGAFIWGLSPAASAQNPAAEQASHQPAITRHVGVFNGKRVAYTAIVGETVVADSQGRPRARLVSTSYIADGANPATRPVLFVTNGGPIAPSALLHMLALGPRRMAIPADLAASPSEFRVVDNTYTVLDVTDLVFFDPASTGWSRVVEGVRPEEYYSTAADAEQFAGFINQWRHDHGRLASPIFLLGESYATIRVPVTAARLIRAPEPVAIEGMFLMGQAVNLNDVMDRPYNIVAPIVDMPSMAAAAWYHNKIDRKGRTVHQLMADAMEFAATDYLHALFRGHSLDATRRKQIADRLEQLTGVPSEYYQANDLRIMTAEFVHELFRPEGRRLGLDDARYIGPAGGPSPDGFLQGGAVDALLKYFRQELGVTRTEEYRRRQFPPSNAAAGRGGGGWAYLPVGSPFNDYPYIQAINEVMARNPRFRMMIGSGIYDMKTTTGQAEYLVTTAGWPKSRVRVSRYEGGHMAYTNELALKQFANDIRELVRGPFTTRDR